MKAALLCSLLLASPALAGEPAKAAVKPPKPAARKALEAPAYLSPLARQLLKQRMRRHGGEMLALVQSVLFLDHETTQRLAAELAAEPRLTRPIAGGADDVNAALPERFFVLQDELRSRALELMAATQQPGTPDLARRLGEVTQTCVACHTTYLEPATPATP
jgi:hypothetical protein